MADNTEDKQRALVFGFSARQYGAKISEYLGAERGESHIAMIRRLCQKYSTEALIGHFFRAMGQEYQAKLEAESLHLSQQSTSSSFSSQGSIPSSPQFFAPQPPPLPTDETQSLLTHRNVRGSLPFVLDS